MSRQLLALALLQPCEAGASCMPLLLMGPRHRRRVCACQRSHACNKHFKRGFPALVATASSCCFTAGLWVLGNALVPLLYRLACLLKAQAGSGPPAGLAPDESTDGWGFLGLTGIQEG